MVDLPYEFSFSDSTTIDTVRLLADARSQLPGALLTEIQAGYYAVMREFLDFTNVWQEDIDVPIVVGTRSYTLDIPAMGQANRLLALFDSQADSYVGGPWASPARMDTPGQLFIYTTPATAATWVARVSKTCNAVDSDNNPAVDTWIIAKYWQALMWGVLRNLMGQAGKPYTNTQLAMFHGKSFVAEKAKARLDALQGNVRGQVTWGFPHASRGSQRGM
jgi:hypothetical protein